MKHLFSNFSILGVLLFLFPINLFAFGGGPVQYFDSDLVTMGNDTNSISSTNYMSFTTGDTIHQSFKVKPTDPNARSVLAQHLFLSRNWWSGDGIVLLNFYEGEGTSGTLIYSDTLDLQTPDGESGFLYPGSRTKYMALSDKLSHLDTLDKSSSFFDTEGISLMADSTYTFAIIIESIEQINRDYGFGFYCTSQPYSEGESSNPYLDIWFKIAGKVDSDADPLVSYAQNSANKFDFDTSSFYFPSKIVGLSAPEIVQVSHPSKSLSYEIESPSLLTISETAGGLSLNGLQEGSTRVFVKNGSDTLSFFKVDVLARKYLDVSFSYINYPGESNHSLRQAFDSISTFISDLYEEINVEVSMVNHGNIEWDWDLDGDGQSYDINQYEALSPIDSGVLVNMDDYFSNLYVLRFNKNDSYHGGSNGAGSSNGWGSSDFPRAAYKRIHLFDNTYSIGSTLSHELAHNLGLGHYSQSNRMYYPTPNATSNLMKTGRSDNKIYAFQWNRIHETISEAKANGEDYSPEMTVDINHSHTHDLMSFHVNPQRKEVELNVSSGFTQIDVFDVSGQRVFSKIVPSNERKVKMPNLNSGAIYFFRVNSSSIQSTERHYIP